jgi:V8-like Glu-specific endopeptidase
MRMTSLVAVGIAALTLALAVAACGGDDESGDETPTAEDRNAAVSSAPIGASAEDPQEILEYWTPEREAEATPLDIVREGDPPEQQGGPQAGPFDTPDAEGPEGSSEGVVTPSARVGGSASTDDLDEGGIGAATPGDPNWARYAGGTKKLPFRHVGVLFFHSPSEGKDFTCSAAVVAAPNRSTVWTAGHCVHEGSGGAWMEKVKFVPGYQGGKKPYGEWPVKMQPGPVLTTTGGWADSADFDVDFGAVVVAPRGGKRLQDVVGGGQGILWNPRRVPKLVDFGYPAEPTPPFEFQQGPYHCGSRVVGRMEGEPRPLAIDCYFGRGASGGPWIVDYRPKRGWGYVTSVNSFGFLDDRRYYYGPYPGEAVKNVFNSVKNA